ncbi:hypothetical protein A3H38_03570 [candidate division WOR-1 bacterium RIFCSPLOWO2_02_FULL_46_20]|nr:MAG: hypothetical protein A3H38_03570 [candidate division WOR-1 bacterium RIFCSPLOWO2_02_FULL_46_20]
MHGFATGPIIWKDQVRGFAKDYKVVTDIERLDHSTDVYVVGWSMGGWKALDLFAEHRQEIRGLVLVSAFPKYVKSADYPCGAPLALLKRLEKKFLTDYKQGMNYFYDLIFKDKQSHHLIDHLPVPERGDLEKWFKRLEHDDLRGLLPTINVPVLLIHGDKDPIVSAQTATYMKDRIKESDLHLLAGVGHAPFLEDKERFNKLLRDFISKHEKY